jgi:hypothetical protein
MTDETLEAGLFAVDRDARTIRGVLIPWGERSRLSISKTKPVTFRRGDVKVPRDPSLVGLNRMHDRFDPIGRATQLEDTDAGLVATFRIADTDDGDAYLAEPGNLRRLSAEVRAMMRRDDGSATAEVVGAALVDEGAFASAALFAIDAAETPEPDDETDDDETPETPEPAAEPDGTPEPDAAPDTEQEEDTVAEAEVPNTFAATTAAPSKQHMSKGEMFGALAAIATGRATPDIIARMQDSWGGVGEAGLFALSDIKYDGTGGLANTMTRPQWLGEVLDGTTYEPRFAPLFGHADLSGLTMSGWKWNVKPTGGAWAGNKAAIPSGTASLTAVSETASRWAGGHDHAREHVDFGTPGYFEAYYAAMVESYLRWRDEDIVLTEAVAAATAVEADNPSGLSIGSAMSKLVDGAASVVAAGLVPTFAILPTAEWKAILKTPSSDVLGYLTAALGLDSGELENSGFVIRPSAEVTNPLVGARSAATVYELPGSPIRVEALNIANGGIDTGLFGYAGLLVNNAAGLVSVTPYTP